MCGVPPTLYQVGGPAPLSLFENRKAVPALCMHTAHFTCAPECTNNILYSICGWTYPVSSRRQVHRLAVRSIASRRVAQYGGDNTVRSSSQLLVIGGTGRLSLEEALVTYGLIDRQVRTVATQGLCTVLLRT
jgi:hypothetical protein